jgi:hypothetical protein
MDFQNANLEQKLNAQRQAEANSPATAQAGAAIGSGLRRPSVAQEHESAINHHRDHLEKNIKATMFYRENPAFAEFVDLIRRGIIQI